MEKIKTMEELSQFLKTATKQELQSYLIDVNSMLLGVKIYAEEKERSSSLIEWNFEQIQNIVNQDTNE
jgi:predicted membrane chloride channel (bestrophin family)